jgi:hypothetical protein
VNKTFYDDFLPTNVIAAVADEMDFLSISRSAALSQ